MTHAATAHLKVSVSSKEILALALPIALAMLVPQINFIANNVFLGALGQTELAVAGITGVYYLIFAAIGYGLNNGLQALIARRAGQNKPLEIGVVFNQGMWIALVIAAVGIACTYFVAPAIFKQVLADEEKAGMAIRFLYVRIWGLPFLYLFQIRNGLLVGTNNSRYLIIGTLLEAALNVLLDYALIFGKLGLPHMGFMGAAWASAISEVAGLVVMMLVVRFIGLRTDLQLARTRRFKTAESRLVLLQSSPLIAQHAISIVSWEFFYIMIEHYGTRDLAVSNTMRNVFGIFGCFAWSFAAASNTMVSNIIGQGMQHRVQELIWKIARISLAIAMLWCLVLNLAPSLFLTIYGQDEAFVQYAIPVLRVVSIALVIMSVSTVWLNAVTGTGNTRVNLGIELVAVIAYTLYVWMVLHVLRLPIGWGWASEWLYWMVMLSLSFAYIRSNKWKNKVI
jgi:putative MATE family efflux protein